MKLNRDEIHVWLVNLDQPDAAALLEILSDDERDRAARFIFEHHRRHYIAARGLLRTILARYLGFDPQRLRFVYGPHGKPGLETGELRFNLSHSENRALYGVTLDKEIGIDVERIREDFASLDIARRFFSTAEVAALNCLSPGEQTRAFFNCWTRKEAYIKARSTGVSHGLHNFTVSLDQQAALISDDSDSQAVSKWSLIDLTPEHGYASALAVEAGEWKLKLRRYPEDMDE